MEKVFFLNRFIMRNEWGGCWQTHTTNTHPLSFTGNWEDYKLFFEGTRPLRELKYREIEKQKSKSKLLWYLHYICISLSLSLSFSLSINGINCYLFYKSLKQIKWKIGLMVWEWRVSSITSMEIMFLYWSWL